MMASMNISSKVGYVHRIDRNTGSISIGDQNYEEQILDVTTIRMSMNSFAYAKNDDHRLITDTAM